MPNRWKETHNVVDQYLSGGGLYEIIPTRLRSQKSSKLQEMRDWCEENVKGSWSIASLPENNFRITFRMWDLEAAEKFKKRFQIKI